MRLSSETKKIEQLPYSTVIYPRGAFIVFQNDIHGFALCECMKGAVENYLKLRSTTHKDETHLDLWNFPESFVDYMNKKLKSDGSIAIKSIMDWGPVLPYVPKLCHRCNKQKPTVKYCPESEGTLFRQNYGWYLNMKHYEFGVVPRLIRYLPTMESQSLKELIDFTYVSLGEDILYDPAIDGFDKEVIESWLTAHDNIWNHGNPRIWDPQFPYNFTQSLERELRRRKTAVRRYIEDAIRADFEYQPLVGKWKSEQALFEFVKKLLPKIKIKRNFRPRMLDHLEMDIYLPELKIGIEYQGIQHYEPVAHWGGKKALERVQLRDARKKELCDENEIELIYFHHYEVLTLELVYKKLVKFIPNIKLKPNRKLED